MVAGSMRIISQSFATQVSAISIDPHTRRVWLRAGRIPYSWPFSLGCRFSPWRRGVTGIRFCLNRNTPPTHFAVELHIFLDKDERLASMLLGRWTSAQCRE